MTVDLFGKELKDFLNCDNTFLTRFIAMLVFTNRGHPHLRFFTIEQLLDCVWNRGPTNIYILALHFITL